MSMTQLADKSDEVGRAIDNIRHPSEQMALPAAIRNLKTISKACVEAYERRQEVVVLS
jgi:hypothetical protein